MQRSRYTDGGSGDMWYLEATAEAGSNLSLCIAVEGGRVWIRQYVTINMSAEERQAVLVFVLVVLQRKLCPP